MVGGGEIGGSRHIRRAPSAHTGSPADGRRSRQALRGLSDRRLCTSQTQPRRSEISPKNLQNWTRRLGIIIGYNGCFKLLEPSTCKRLSKRPTLYCDKLLSTADVYPASIMVNSENSALMPLGHETDNPECSSGSLVGKATILYQIGAVCRSSEFPIWCWSRGAG